MCPVLMVDKILRLDTNVINAAYNLKLYQGNSRGKKHKRDEMQNRLICLPK